MFFEKIINVTQIKIGFVLRVDSHTNSKDWSIIRKNEGELLSD